MPIFTPDLQHARSKLGRPWKMFFTTAWWESVTMFYKNGQWNFVEFPSDDDLAGATHVWQQRENWISYDEVRDMNLTDYGCVRYIDDYDDRFTDEFVSIDNTPFDRATNPEPIHYGGTP